VTEKEGTDSPETQPAPAPETESQPLPEQLAEGGSRSALAGVASTIADAAGPVISAALRPVDQLASGARRMLGERSGARVRQVRRMGRKALLNLWESHPEARRAAIRELGLQTVPVELVVGTAVEGPAQRGGDFLPLRDRRGADWRGRWQRILSAVDSMVSLPPIDLLKLGEEYWVMDGHNRVAAALYTGQIAMDAVVTELRLPGVASDRTPVVIAPYLDGSLDLREAGSGRLTRTSARPDAVKNRPDEAGERRGDEAGEEVRSEE
jgi:hypothetical protein